MDLYENTADIKKDLIEAEREEQTALAELEVARIRSERATMRAQALRQLVSAYQALRTLDQPGTEQQRPPPDVRETLRPGPTIIAPANEPRGREAIRRILEEDITRSWRVPDLADEIERRGWIGENVKDKRAAVATSLKRLVDDGHAMRVSTGLYRTTTNLPSGHPLAEHARVVGPS